MTLQGIMQVAMGICKIGRYIRLVVHGAFAISWYLLNCRTHTVFGITLFSLLFNICLQLYN